MGICLQKKDFLEFPGISQNIKLSQKTVGMKKASCYSWEWKAFVGVSFFYFNLIDCPKRWRSFISVTTMVLSCWRTAHTVITRWYMESLFAGIWLTMIVFSFLSASGNCICNWLIFLPFMQFHAISLSVYSRLSGTQGGKFLLFPTFQDFSYFFLL